MKIKKSEIVGRLILMIGADIIFLFIRPYLDQLMENFGQLWLNSFQREIWGLIIIIMGNLLFLYFNIYKEVRIENGILQQ